VHADDFHTPRIGPLIQHAESAKVSIFSAFG